MTLAAYLDELERKRAEATQGEWLEADAPGTRWDTPLVCGYDRRFNHATGPWFATGPRAATEEQVEHDSRLIVAAVNNLADLIAVARAADRLNQSCPHESEGFVCNECASELREADTSQRAALARLAARAGDGK